jgi:[histone H3]-lysine36 N-dimethyltransferase SETMAR
MNAAHYVEIFDRLRYSIKNKRRGTLSQEIFLLHANALSHSARLVQNSLMTTGLVQLDHPPYSPDLAPSDFYLFPAMKRILRGKRYSSDNAWVNDVKVQS